MKYILPLLLFCVPAQAEVVREMGDLITKDNVNSAVTIAAATTLTGPLTLAGSSLTVTGNAFSVGASTFVVKEGLVGIGLSPVGTAKLQITQKTGLDTAEGGIKILNSASTGSMRTFVDGANASNIYSGATGGSILNLNLTGAVTIPGSAFSVGTSTFVVTGGKVGVGTASPSTPLNASIALTSNYAASLTAGQSIANSPIRIDNLGTGNTNTGLVMFAGDTNSAVTLLSTIKTASTAGDLAISLRDASSSINEKMRVTSAGLVGIGTGSPASKVDISSGTIRMAGTGAPPVGFALCLAASGAMGTCSDTPAANGACTCVAP